uniref:RNA-directed RNA polymerase catalytic subunit n=1 Tax=Beihai orthomyxo-like virus 1 TaxID=1922494 RepID=A0A1L3KKN3_9VIRU|nr:polymerase PB1 [Beihai orthomyxo-like virus 1]
MRDYYLSSIMRAKKQVDLEAKAGIQLPRQSMRKNISNISFFYQYVNTPPLAQGSPAPKVAESVIRSNEYNHLPNQGRSHDWNRQYWLNSDGPFPYGETSSNFHLGKSIAMLKDYLMIHYKDIDDVAQQTMNFLRNENADTLTKGRQTWDPVNFRSVPSADAFRVMEKIFRQNTGKSTHSCLEFLRSFNELLDKNALTYEQKKYEYSERQCLNRKLGRFEKKKVKRLVKRVITEDNKQNVRSKLMEWACSFCSYLKSKERSKLRRRAIASPNMILRMFFLAIEEFHLKLGKIIEGSTISIGGEEKKAKIMREMAKIRSYPEGASVQGTEDKTKWNECLAPELFALMHEIWFNNEIRKELRLPLCNMDLVEFGKILVTGNYLISMKKVKLGEGHIAVDENFEGRFEWIMPDREKMNSKTKEWYDKCHNDIDEDGYLFAPYGMLMGMMNAASTTLACIAIRHGYNPGIEDAQCLMSSDDSMSIYTNKNPENVYRTINKMKANYKELGMNISEKKTLYFREGFGEYTSWYIDGTFGSQYGTETSRIRPQGKNPVDDFHSVSMGAATSLRELKMNVIGAESYITLGISNVRRLWRINKIPNKRENVRDDILLLADGGLNPWNSTNCHLHEIPLKEELMKPLSEFEREYYLKVVNPENPFTQREQSHTSYSIETGTLIETETEIPRNVFHYIKKSNRTVKNDEKSAELIYQKSCDNAVKIYEKLVPSSVLFNPTGSRSMAKAITEVLGVSKKTLQESNMLTEAEVDLIQEAINYVNV